MATRGRCISRAGPSPHLVPQRAPSWPLPGDIRCSPPAIRPRCLLRFSPRFSPATEHGAGVAAGPYRNVVICPESFRASGRSDHESFGVRIRATWRKSTVGSAAAAFRQARAVLWEKSDSKPDTDTLPPQHFALAAKTCSGLRKRELRRSRPCLSAPLCTQPLADRVRTEHC